MAIRAIMGFELGKVNQANFYEVFDNRKLSIACDDSCGTMRELGRCDIRLYEDENDVTVVVFPEYAERRIVTLDADSLYKASYWLRFGAPPPVK